MNQNDCIIILVYYPFEVNKRTTIEFKIYFMYTNINNTAPYSSSFSLDALIKTLISVKNPESNHFYIAE